ncbi:hypothetical protein AXK11_01125 [Cephaloticoccus primus]|uniref:Toxin HicA n=1 Tax=Cephaloticoccus primus TaxID=1548207 RepID=A0A139SUL9_9BACT|nr:type II toxin-antitoxin system HicA family toxin [Cephaloticoccus primus]KXU38152.1 hypothetical protein AXK11_01125 [Cephaloticoccus primus]
MANWKKTLERILDEKGRYDASIAFGDFRVVLVRVGYVLAHRSGSHQSYRQKGWELMVVVPRADGKAKEYSVKDLRKELKEHGY